MQDTLLKYIYIFFMPSYLFVGLYKCVSLSIYGSLVKAANKTELGQRSLPKRMVNIIASCCIVSLYNIHSCLLVNFIIFQQKMSCFKTVLFCYHF